MSGPSTRAPHPALAAWTALRAQASGRGAIVTLVRADGTSKPVGAHLALAEDGRAFGSVTIGGCAGDVELLVDRVGFDARDAFGEAMAAAEAGLERGVRVAAITPLGDTAGQLVVSEDGIRAGSVGSAARDEAAAALASAALREGDGAVGVREAAGERWLVQLLAPTRTLLLVGATEIAAVLCALAAPLGWRTVLIDPRDELLAEPRFAAATERHAALPAEVVARRVGGAGTAVVIVAHDYKVELPVLRVALRAEVPYVGMLGSRKRAATVRAMLADDGVTESEVARLRAPIGLSIGSQGAGEIAVSIIAEVIATWRGAAIAARA